MTGWAGVGPVAPRPLDDLAPLLDWLRTGRQVAGRTDFPAGTAMPDGRLDLCKQALGPDGVRAIVSALPPRGPVRHLLLGTDGLGDAGAADATRGAIGAGVETVYLGCNGIGAAGVRDLADRLIASPGVVRGLWLKRNPLGGDGGRAAGRLLARGSGLATLDLVQTGLDAAASAALAEGVEAVAARGDRVGRLYLGGNVLDAAQVARVVRTGAVDELYVSAAGLGDAGARVLARALRAAPPGLTHLSVASNGIGPEPLMELVAAAAAAGVTLLDLSRVRAAGALGAPDNRLDEPATAAIAAVLSGTRHRLAHLILRDTGITGRGALALVAGARRAISPTRYALGPGVASRAKRELAELSESVPPLSPHPDVAAIASVHRTRKPA
ncbi:ribonuclease inhibitor [Nonomuraea sp. PA05]|uniref:ribonuclease inhibitor n=1 Tax=Nonomuraea sp. PA05 TaxID=2604466 RepID=UPI0021CC630B|nr:ribonuclease inhibitor [Nonomuraea sp. PA05]